MAEEISSKEVSEKHTAYLDVGSGAEPIVRLGDKIIIDVRPKRNPKFSKPWINPSDFKKYGEVVSAVREVIASALYHKDVTKPEFQNLVGLSLIKALKDLGFNQVENAQVTGKIPEHWKPGHGLKKSQLILDTNAWAERKAELQSLRSN